MQSFLRSFKLAALCLATLQAHAQLVPTMINYQGRLTDNTPSQAPLTATVSMSFEIWDVASGGADIPNRLWVEPASGTVPVAVTGGIFNVLLGGNGVPVPAAIFNSANPMAERYLQIIANGETLAPRQRIGSTANALQAQNAYQAQSAQFATSATDSGMLGGLAPGGYQLATAQSCAGGQFISAIDPTGYTVCAAPNGFSGSLTGDVTGAQSATVVAMVGGQTSANVAAGTLLANSATNVSTASTLVKRDSSGNFAAGTITAALSGNAATATALAANGANCAAGTLPLGVNAAGGVEGCASANGSITAPLLLSGSIPGAMISAVNANGDGIYGESTLSDGVQGYSSGSGRAGHFQIFNGTNNNAALTGITSGTGSGVMGVSASGDAVNGYTSSSGRAGFFQINNAANGNDALSATTNGTGSAGAFTATNAANSSSALYASSSGIGIAGSFFSAAGHGVAGTSAGATTYGGYFSSNNANGTALFAEGSGATRTRATLKVNNTEPTQGVAAYVTASSTFATAHLANASTGEVLFLQNGGTDAAGTGGGDFIRAVNELETDIQFRVLTTGEVRSDVGFNTPAADFAEMLSAEAGLEAGEVLVIGADGKLARSLNANDPAVAGVYSTAPGFVGGRPVDGDIGDRIPLAVVGVIPVKATTENGPIRPGDLLVSSSRPGHAMRAPKHPEAGTVIGKALTPLAAGSGVITLLANMQ